MRAKGIDTFRYAVLGAVLFVSTACSSGPKTTTLVNNDGWSFPMPSELTKTKQPLPTGYQQFAGPLKDGYRTTLVISSLADSHTATEEGQDIVKDPPQGLKIQNSGPYAMTGMEAFSIVATQEDGKVSQRQVIIKGKDVCVTMTLTSKSDEFDKWDQTFQDCLKQFKWKKS